MVVPYGKNWYYNVESVESRNICQSQQNNLDNNWCLSIKFKILRLCLQTENAKGFQYSYIGKFFFLGKVNFLSYICVLVESNPFIVRSEL